MTTLSHQSRVSPESTTKDDLLIPLSSSQAEASTSQQQSALATSITPKASASTSHHKSRFRRRKRNGGGTAPTYRRSSSSMSLEDESSSSLFSERGTTTSVIKKKKKSLLRRLLTGGKSSSKKSLVIETTTTTTPATPATPATPMSIDEDDEAEAATAAAATTTAPSTDKHQHLKKKMTTSYRLKSSNKSKSKGDEILTTLSSDEPTQALDYDEEDFTEIDMLEEQGQQLRLMGQTHEALKAWDEALGLCGGPRDGDRDQLEEDREGEGERPTPVPTRASSSFPICKSNQIKCRMIDLHVRLAQQQQQQQQHRDRDEQEPQLEDEDVDNSTTVVVDHLEQANRLIAQLEPLQINDNSAGCLQPSPLLMELLTNNSCWTYALQVSHQMMLLDQPVEPLLLARLHLEVALQKQQPSQQQNVHLAECHQLLLSVTNNNSGSSDVDDATTSTSTTLDTLWQELAQAYAALGEEELALGCSQSRMQRLLSTNPQQVALAHYDYALNVYSPAQQYGLALKEAELALSALNIWKTNKTTTDIDIIQEQGGGDDGDGDGQPRDAVEVKEESQDDDEASEEEAELLLIKLYQFKADVLCRMGRIPDSIQSYEQLLTAYLESRTSHYGPVDAANVLYILGKLSVRIKQFKSALEYFDRELQMTQSVIGEGSPHLAISKIHHEQAKVADAGLMDYPLAVQYYEKALRVETGVYQQAKKDYQQQKQQQQQSQSSTSKQQRHQQKPKPRLLQQHQKPVSGSSLAVPSSTSSLLQDAKYQMGETKQCLGKLHFKMGDFATAVRTTLAVDK